MGYAAQKLASGNAGRFQTARKKLSPQAGYANVVRPVLRKEFLLSEINYCHFCNYEIEGWPHFCPNCGKANEHNIFLRMTRINDRIAAGTATKADYEFVKVIQKEVEDFKPPDLRTPFEKTLSWLGIIIGVLAFGYMVWKLASYDFEVFLMFVPYFVVLVIVVIVLTKIIKSLGISRPWYGLLYVVSLFLTFGIVSAGHWLLEIVRDFLK